MAQIQQAVSMLCTSKATRRDCCRVLCCIHDGEADFEQAMNSQALSCLPLPAPAECQVIPSPFSYAPMQWQAGIMGLSLCGGGGSLVLYLFYLSSREPGSVIGDCLSLPFVPRFLPTRHPVERIRGMYSAFMIVVVVVVIVAAPLFHRSVASIPTLSPCPATNDKFVCTQRAIPAARLCWRSRASASK